MSWQIQYSETAKKQLEKLDKSVGKKVKAYLSETANLADPAARGHALTGTLSGCHRYRIGQLRIIVKIERNIIAIVVLSMGKRDSIY